MHPLPADPIHAAILGNDTVLAARPAEPIQLARACLLAGFDLVAPVSWGEELLALHVTELVERRCPPAVVVSTCPFVAETLRRKPPVTPCIVSVSPPVAAARFLREMLADRRVEITYVGSCPGAASDEIDEVLVPDVLLMRLAEAGLDLEHLPRHLDGHLPPERSRHASNPGGIPHPRWMAERNGAIVLEATPSTLDAVASIPSDTTLVLDLEQACGCACARDRMALAQMDPPRSDLPIVAMTKTRLSDAGILADSGVVILDENPVVAIGMQMHSPRATFLARGLTGTDVPETTLPAEANDFSLLTGPTETGDAPVGAEPAIPPAFPAGETTGSRPVIPPATTPPSSTL